MRGSEGHGDKRGEGKNAWGMEHEQMGEYRVREGRWVRRENETGRRRVTRGHVQPGEGAGTAREKSFSDGETGTVRAAEGAQTEEEEIHQKIVIDKCGSKSHRGRGGRAERERGRGEGMEAKAADVRSF
ncbi:hypothetical protein NDU88_004005 [Pleurodeles waltl]|uniref:Uncharacterized protein n=1 Tax=Pleurodeles waltl TaxID=8319 RepID=A0AAV7QAL7_PLEWA|nr:hypothetical protein NDU88_004005 [Pleurodeles waltl]